MRMHYGIGLLLVLIGSVSGCCCPMSCAPYGCMPVSCCPQTCWTDQLQDSLCDMSDWMQDQNCNFQQNMACQIHLIKSNLTPKPRNCRTDSRYCEPIRAGKVPSASECYGPNGLRQPSAKCPRCGKHPCRCRDAMVGDGFVEVESNAPVYEEGQFVPFTEMPESYESQGPWEPGLDGQVHPESLPPARSYDEPNPVPPEPEGSPTPIYKAPPMKTDSQGAARTGNHNSEPRGHATVSDNPFRTLEQIDYRRPQTTVPHSDGWKPVRLLPNRAR